VLETGSPQGTARARNRAIEAARGAILAFLDDDDLFLPDHLATLVEAMVPSGAPVAYTESEAVEERIEEGRRVVVRRGTARQYRYSRALLLVRNMIATANWGMRRECFERWGGFDDSLACAEDWDLLLRFSEKTPFLRLARTTTEIRVRAGTPDSVTQRIPLRPTCDLLYRRYPAGPSELIALGREVYAASITNLGNLGPIAASANKPRSA
jgi:glycosyltransferase involved in cell wall biosynthesis